MSIKNSLNKNEAIAETTANPNSMFPEEKDPFDKPLEDNLIMNDTLFEEARNSVTVDGMEYSFLKPPYMNFDDQLRTNASSGKLILSMNSSCCTAIPAAGRPLCLHSSMKSFRITSI